MIVGLCGVGVTFPYISAAQTYGFDTNWALLTVPVAGPFLALPYMSDADGKALGALAGGFQLLGLGLTIFGAVTLSNYNRRGRVAQQALAGRRLFVSGVATPRYSGASLLFRF